MRNSPEILMSLGKSKNEHKKSKASLMAFTILYGVLALVVIYVMTSGGMGVSFDSERYLISAYHLKHVEVDKAFRIVSPGFPIFYPFTISIVQWLGLGEGASAARIISLFAFVISVIAVFYLGLLIQGKTTAHLSAVTLLVFAPVLYVFSYCWSETVYIPLSLLSLLLLIFYLKAPQEKSIKYLLASGLLAGLGLVTRYLGLSMIITGLLAIILLSNAERMSKKIKEIISFGSMACLPILFYVWGCYISLHQVFRGSVPSRFSLIEQASLFFLTIYRDFLTFYLTFDKNVQLLFNSNLQGRLSHVLFWSNIIILLCILAGAFILVKTVFSLRVFRTWIRPQVEVLGYVVIYVLMVVNITSGVAVDRMGTRFAAPLYPLFLLLTFSIITHMYQALDKKRMKRWLIGLSASVVSLFWVIQIISSYNVYKTVSSGSFPYMEQPGNRNRESLKFIQENAGPGDVIISNVPYKLAFIWPRQVPYLGISIKKDSSATKLSITEIPDSLSFLWPWEVKGESIFVDRSDQVSYATGQSRHSSVYILLCTKDFSHYFTPVETIEALNQKIGLFSWAKVFGNDYIYKTEALVFDSPEARQKALSGKLANFQPSGTHR